MKKILVTQRITENRDYPEIRDCLDVRWSQFFKHINCLPVLLPSETDHENYFKEMDIHGILLTGGNDLADISGKKIDKKRDILERELMDYSVQNRIPVLGVCRGMQFLGSYFGMRLIKTEGHVTETHKIITDRGICDGFCKPGDTMVVNSYHNYGFKDIGDDFSVLATAEDGVIEAMKHKEYEIYGIMWHPERMSINNIMNRKIIQFINKR